MVCGTELVGIKHRKTCSPKCKKIRKSEYDKARYQADPEPVKARAAAWDRRRKQSYDAEYRKRPDRLIAHKISKRNWRDRDLEHAKALARNNTARRRARIDGGGAFQVSEKDLVRIASRFDGCAYCENGKLEEWDHIVPISRGGRHSIGNLAPSCRDCNRSKSHRTVTEWRSGKVVQRSAQLM